MPVIVCGSCFAKFSLPPRREVRLRGANGEMNVLAVESNRLGMTSHRAGHVAEAEAAYTIALARDPHYSEAYAVTQHYRDI